MRRARRSCKSPASHLPCQHFYSHSIAVEGEAHCLAQCLCHDVSICAADMCYIHHAAKCNGADDAESQICAATQLCCAVPPVQGCLCAGNGATGREGIGRGMCTNTKAALDAPSCSASSPSGSGVPSMPFHLGRGGVGMLLGLLMHHCQAASASPSLCQW